MVPKETGQPRSDGLQPTNAMASNLIGTEAQRGLKGPVAKLWQTCSVHRWVVFTAVGAAPLPPPPFSDIASWMKSLGTPPSDALPSTGRENGEDGPGYQGTQ